MQAMMKKMPFGGGGSISDEQLRDGEQKLKRFGAFVELMSVPPVESAVLAVPQLAALSSLGRKGRGLLVVGGGHHAWGPCRRGDSFV